MQAVGHWAQAARQEGLLRAMFWFLWCAVVRLALQTVGVRAQLVVVVSWLAYPAVCDLHGCTVAAIRLAEGFPRSQEGLLRPFVYKEFPSCTAGPGVAK